MSDVVSTIPPGDGAGQQKFFISYRRTDKNDAARQIKHALGDSAYFDVDEPPGIDWLKRIRTSISEALVVVVVIGPFWLSILQTRDRERREGGGEDYTRREIEWALASGRCHVVPVLVDAVMPEPATVPRSLRAVCAKQALSLHHESFDVDLRALVAHLDVLAATPVADEPWEPDPAATSAGASTASDAPAPSPDHFARVAAAMLTGDVVPVLGTSLRGDLPDTAFIAQELAGERKWPPTTSDLAEIAQRYVATVGSARLYREVERLLAPSIRLAAVHRFLAEFPRLVRHAGHEVAPQLIISTNYDRSLELAFTALGEPFDYAVYIPKDRRFLHVPWGETSGEPVTVLIDDAKSYKGFPINSDGELERTVILKVNGSTSFSEAKSDWSQNYVITEDHFIDYVSAPVIQEQLPALLLNKLRDSNCLFLGYTLHDWNARILLRQIWQGEPIDIRSWAVADRPDALEGELWSSVSQGKVTLLGARPGDYVDALRSELVSVLALA